MGFKRKTFDTGTRKEGVSHTPKPMLRRAPKKGPTLVSIGMELIVAVGINLLRRHVKTWGADLNAKRKELAAPEKVSSGEAIRRPRDPIVEAISEEVKKENSHPPRGTRKEVAWFLLKKTATQWINDKCPQLGAALAYFTVFSLAPLVLILLAFFGLFFGSDHAREKIVEQLRYLIDPSGIKVIQDIASSTSKPQSG